VIPVTSRYYGLPTAQRTLPDGRTVVYLTRRFLPPGDSAVVVFEYPVTPADRLDLLAATYFADAEQFWRIADANDAMNPADLIPPPPDPTVLPGTTGGPQPRLRIPQPQAGG
jgi:hypothetical protein